MNQRRLDYIDTLRAAAAIGVIVYHLRLIAVGKPLPVPDWVIPITDRVMEAGVPLFFVISGFLLTMLMPSYERHSRPLLAFYVKRYFRIAPMFYATIAIWCLWARTTPTALTTLANVTFTFNLFPSQANSTIFAGWTVGVEMLFYLVFPIFYRLLPNLPLKTVAFVLATILSAHFNRYLVRSLGPSDIYVAMNVLFSLPLFILGMMTFDLLKALERWTKRREQMAWVLLAGCVVAFSLVTHHRTVVFNERYWQGFACSLLLLSFALHPPRLVNPATAYIGRISYSMYLLHGFIIVNMGAAFEAPYRMGLPRLLAFAVSSLIALVVVIPFSILTYVLIEKPGNAAGLWVVRRLGKSVQPIEGRTTAQSPFGA